MNKRLAKELQELSGAETGLPFAKSVSLVGDNLNKWKVILIGPVRIPSLISAVCGRCSLIPPLSGQDSVREGHLPTRHGHSHRVPLQASQGTNCVARVTNRRLTCVQVKFATKIYHPNVKSDGGVCHEMLNDGWSPQLKLSEVLLMVNQILKEPNPENPLEPEIANQYKADRNAFNKQAKEWTKKCVILTVSYASRGFGQVLCTPLHFYWSRSVLGSSLLCLCNFLANCTPGMRAASDLPSECVSTSCLAGRCRAGRRSPWS